MLVVVGLGGNQGSDAEIIGRFRAAVQVLHDRGYGRLMTSQLYRSAPVGPVLDQPAFLNAALAFETCGAVSPLALLIDLLDIEELLGRRRQHLPSKGPRPIDLDLLVVDQCRVEVAGPPTLTLPHPGICKRAFVLHPMKDLLGGEFVVPGTGRTVSQCLDSSEVAAQPIRRLVLAN